jgi:two-component system phosphate regulon sensor histidine kinase PhoR
MDQGVIASVPLGLIVFTALVLIALGMVIGWMGTRTRIHKKSERVAHQHITQVSTILDALPQAALTTDNEAHIIAHNTLAAKLLVELNWKSDFPIMLDAAIGRVIRSGIAETMEIATQSKPVHRVQVTISPLRVADRRSETLVLFNNLGTGANRAEVYQRLIGTIAHELRTPLTAITGHVDIMNSCRFDEEALWRRSLGFVETETQRLTRLVEDFLSLSRLDRISLHRKPINLRVAVEEAVSALFETAEQNKVVPIIQAPIDIPLVMGDPDRLRQVFLNLLDNAIKYAPGSSLTVRLTPEEGFVRVEVSDNGSGIPAEDLPYIFEPFRRGRQAAPGTKGTGLGLTIVRAILDQHQAPISVQSEAGQTTFTFSLTTAHAVETERTNPTTL